MIKSHYDKVKSQLHGASLCIVSKKRSLEEIMSYYEAEERIFGENHAKELVEKAKQLPHDIQWHFIGHLQRNKVKDILPYVSMIQSLDNMALAQVIEKEANKIDKQVDVLVEFHLAEDDLNKTGLAKEEAIPFITQCLDLKHIHIKGIMVMGPHTEDKEKIASVFEEASRLFHQIRDAFPEEDIRILSMGMSDDYPIALSHGSNMVRIGTYLFTE